MRRRTVTSPFSSYTDLALEQGRKFDPEKDRVTDWPLFSRMFARFVEYRDTLVEADFHMVAKREGLE
jgi:hypothetical protein